MVNSQGPLLRPSQSLRACQLRNTMYTDTKYTIVRQVESAREIPLRQVAHSGSTVFGPVQELDPTEGGILFPDTKQYQIQNTTKR